MEIQKNNSTATTLGAKTSFTGVVHVTSLFAPNENRNFSSASVTFAPGARTFWHTHPLGQTLIITSGVGLVQCWGGKIEEVKPGDVVWFPPLEKHWHGATTDTSMTHIVIQEHLNGKAVDWLEEVSNKQYLGQ